MTMMTISTMEWKMTKKPESEKVRPAEHRLAQRLPQITHGVLLVPHDQLPPNGKTNLTQAAARCPVPKMTHVCQSKLVKSPHSPAWVSAKTLKRPEAWTQPGKISGGSSRHTPHALANSSRQLEKPCFWRYRKVYRRSPPEFAELSLVSCAACGRS